MLNQTLQQIGLTPKESQIYEILLRLGQVPISDLIKETQDHPQIVYRAIDGLESKNLVICANIRHKKHVRAEDPQKLVEIEEKRLKEINKIIPTLEALRTAPKEAIIRVNKGAEAVRNFRINTLDEVNSGDTVYVIGGSGSDYFTAMGDHFNVYEKKRISRGIFKKLISFESQREGIESSKIQKELAEHRYLPENYPIPSTTHIVGNKVGIIIWQPEIIVIVIESPQIAESYIHYFNVLWQIAKE